MFLLALAGCLLSFLLGVIISKRKFQKLASEQLEVFKEKLGYVAPEESEAE